jgi:hypothetical protein
MKMSVQGVGKIQMGEQLILSGRRDLPLHAEKSRRSCMMKRIESVIVSSIVAVAFAGIAFAAEPVGTPGHPETAPASPETYTTVKPGETKKPVVKKKARKKIKKHKSVKPAAVKSEVPSPDTTAPTTK